MLNIILQSFVAGSSAAIFAVITITALKLLQAKNEYNKENVRENRMTRALLAQEKSANALGRIAEQLEKHGK